MYTNPQKPNHYRKPSPSSITYPKTVQVTNRLDCPDPHCTINFQHSYTLLKIVPPCAPNTPCLHITRFSLEEDPFQDANRWKVATNPGFKLDGGQMVYVQNWGTLTLLRQANEEVGFTIFRAMDEERMVELELAAISEWCYYEERQTSTMRLQQAFKKLWRKRHLLIRPKVIHFLSRK
jgi:hypothetical protein